jgi:DnaJ-class molecular chaperone
MKCPECGGDGGFDVSGPGHSRVTHHDKCTECSGSGEVVRCVSCDDYVASALIDKNGECTYCARVTRRKASRSP